MDQLDAIEKAIFKLADDEHITMSRGAEILRITLTEFRNKFFEEFPLGKRISMENRTLERLILSVDRMTVQLEGIKRALYTSREEAGRPTLSIADLVTAMMGIGSTIARQTIEDSDNVKE